MALSEGAREALVVIAGAVVAVFVILVLAGVTRLIPPRPRTVTVSTELTINGEPVELPTCKELDDLGYDGRASCIDERGVIRTPGR